MDVRRTKIEQLRNFRKKTSIFSLAPSRRVTAAFVYDDELYTGAMMEPERLLLTFERSPEESRLTGVREAIRALGENDIDVGVVAQNPGVDSLIERVLRFWFPYLSSAGITGVVSGAAPGPPAEAGEFIVTLAPMLGRAFGTVLGAWLQARYGRKIRVKFDDIEIEAQTPEQVETLLARLEGLRQSRKAARG